MNKRRREILAALTPAVELVMRDDRRPRRDVPGLAMKARVSAEAPAELMIYGPITMSPWDEGISAADVAGVLREAGPGAINVRINSPGGDVFQGVAIHTLLSRHPGMIHTFNDGLAASAASFILLAGDQITTAERAMTMVHDGMTGAYGNGATLRRSADLLDKVSENIAEMYADRAGEDAAHWRHLMTVNGEDGTWFTGAEAFALGLADDITKVKDDGPEEDLVWDRLAAWSDRLPTAVQAQLDERIGAADPTEEERTDADSYEEMMTCTHGVRDDCAECKAMLTSYSAGADVSRETSDDDDKNFAHAMWMWTLLNKNGHTARKAVAL